MSSPAADSLLSKRKLRPSTCYAETLIRASAHAMTPDDLIRPLKPPARKQRRGIVLPLIAGTLSGVVSGLAILFGAALDRGKPVAPAPAREPALADSVQRTEPVPAPAVAVPTAKTVTLTVIDSQTGAKREVIVPAPTNDQLEEGELILRSTATMAPAEIAGGRGATKAKRR
jgi:hypothetical protein